MQNLSKKLTSEQIAHKAFLVTLNAINGFGQKTILKILNYCQERHLEPKEFLDNKYNVWNEISLSERSVESIKNFKKAHNFIDYLSSLEDSGIQVLTFEEKSYPKLLLETNDFPPVLLVKSLVKVGSSAWKIAFANTISVVGARKMTSYGQLVLKKMVPPLVAAGKVVVSGFMYGIDLTAARVALENHGQTVAVLGFGFNHCFPSSQKKVMADFLERGAIFLSEFSPEVVAKAANFVIRNRIVAGLSKATLVVEAARRSGSHITAGYANDYGRLVMAVPGPITNPFSDGTKALITQGAVLVNSAMDILDEIKEDYHLNFFNSSEDNMDGNQQVKVLLENLSFFPEISFDDLLKSTKLTSEQLNQLLFDLELQGKIIKKWGKYCLVS